MPNGGIGAMTRAQAAAAGQAALAAGRAAMGGGAPPSGQGIGIGADVTAQVTRGQPTPTPTPTPTSGSFWDAVRIASQLAGNIFPGQGLGAAGSILGLGGGGGPTTGAVQQPIRIGESVTAVKTTAAERAAAGALPAGVTYRIPEGAKVGDFFTYEGWVYRVDMDDWNNLIGTPLYQIETAPAGGMSEYERAYLDFMQQQAATQEAERQREWLAALAADPSRWIELSQYTTQQPGTVPEWLSGIYEGQVPTGAPLGEAREVGPVPQLSKQWWEWLSPAEREKLMGYMTWIGQEPEDWMSRMWWMRGQQPFGMGRQFAPFRQYG